MPATSTVWPTGLPEVFSSQDTNIVLKYEKIGSDSAKYNQFQIVW